MTEEKNQKINLYADQLGHRKYTLASLREKIEDQFHEETAGRTDIFQELDTYQKRFQAVTETADYVLAMEYISLPAAEKHQIIEQAVSNLFYFGPLDSYLRDEAITEMTMEGPLEAHIRRGFEDFISIKPPFDSVPHLEQMLSRLIAPAVLMSSDPFLEIGLEFYGRPARLSLIAPPISVMYSIQIRLHPSQPIGIEALVPVHLPEHAQLKEIVTAGHGLLITGEVGVGKTTLLAALVHILNDSQKVMAVERAKEMRLPDSVERLVSVPPRPDVPGLSFGEQIRDALQHHAPRMLALDEIRGDERMAFWDALNNRDVQQLLVAFRGTSDPARLLSALTIAIRKGYPTLEAAALHQTLLEKLPFVVALQRPKKNLPPRLSLLARWVQEGDSLTLQPVGQPDVR
ncbi:MAG: Flp pilus assembly complex ATPase component TadA [Anaerolineae bacterium]|nr:Flp pilus assembly complex ATPase component TadA [Anaerolineae bacterium]